MSYGTRGDGLKHNIKLVGRADFTSYYVCLDGVGHGSAEDVGGHRGWNDLLKMYEADSPTSDQLNQMLWYQSDASNKDISGLREDRKWRWNKDKVNAILKQLGQPEKKFVTCLAGCPFHIIGETVIL
ncbi:uncharacterized protein RAG0_12036 [Rhynchosporium agropyri]|uniref:Plasmid pRiA4b Orf3-like domain-containing protein n=1 Tax=Rhynchosporium agropyri TaxID=914238 RepID=A0A1E1L6R0_9HELO|nr:uncharacterized protein RAG0_12036 [Rhynchosporium agropyri]